MEGIIILLLCQFGITVVLKSDVAEKKYLEGEDPDYQSYLTELSQAFFLSTMESSVLYLATFGVYYGLNKLQMAKLAEFVKKSDTDFFLFSYEQIRKDYPNFSKICQTDSIGVFLDELFTSSKELVLTKLIELFQSKHSNLDSTFVLEAINCCIKVNETSGGLYYSLQFDQIPKTLLLKNGLFCSLQEGILKNYEARIEKYLLFYNVVKQFSLIEKTWRIQGVIP